MSGVPRPTDVLARFAPILSAAFAAALYAPSLTNGLTNWDDPEYVLNNPVAQKGLAGVFAAVTTFVDGAWYPITHATYAVVHAVAGTSALAHHLIQWIAFAAAATLAPLALEAFRVPRRIGLLAALLWIAHPFRPESVSWVANLKDTLSVLGVLGSFALYGRGKRTAAMAAFAGALLAKSAVFPLALLFPFVDLIRGESVRRAVRGSSFFVVAGALCAAVTGWADFASPESMSHTRPGGSLLGAIPTILWKPWWYLGRTLWPSGPRALYADDVVTATDLRLFLALGLFALSAVWIATRPGSTRLAWAAGIAAWLLPFAPVIGTVPMRFHAADRYTLVPGLALAVAVALGLAALARRLNRPPLATGAAMALTLAMVPSNVLRQREWHDGISLFEANRQVEPSIWEVRYNLAGAYGGEGRWDEALRELEETWKLNPSYRRILGDLFFAQAAKAGKDAGWIDRYTLPLERAGYRSEAFLSVAQAVVGDGDVALARVLVELASRDGQRGAAHAVLAKIEWVEGDLEDSVAQARKALELAPQDEFPRVDLVIALADLGLYDEALTAAGPEAKDPRVKPLLKGARGYVLFKMGRTVEAGVLLEEARRELAAPPAGGQAVPASP